MSVSLAKGQKISLAKPGAPPEQPAQPAVPPTERAGPEDPPTQPVDLNERAAGLEGCSLEGHGTGSDRVESEPQPGAPPAPGPMAAVEALSSTVTAMHTTLEQTRAALAELTALRTLDIERFDRLHAEATRLRAGEHAKSIAPLLNALLRLSDQMASLSGDDASVAGDLRVQLLQILDLAAGVTAFQPEPGDAFDSSRHAGVGRVPTATVAADNTISRTLRPGFQRSDGGIVRVAEVEVLRFSAAPDAPLDALPDAPPA